MGTKFLGTYMGDSRLELHGARRDALSWTQLSANLAAGASSLSVTDDASSWRVGDEIVIASSSFEPTEAERVKITAVGGKTVSFSPALKFAHWGSLQSFDGKTVDERAEVGLLTRDQEFELCKRIPSTTTSIQGLTFNTAAIGLLAQETLDAKNIFLCWPGSYLHFLQATSRSPYVRRLRTIEPRINWSRQIEQSKPVSRCPAWSVVTVFC